MNRTSAAFRLVRTATFSVTMITAILCQTHSPAEAQIRNEYGGFDIAGSANQFSETPYSTTRNWSVNAAFANGKLAFCYGEVSQNGTTVRLGYDDMQWQLAVPFNAQMGSWEGSMEVDGDRRFASGLVTSGWVIAWLGLQELSTLKAGHTAVLGLGRADYDFSLAGITAASVKIDECVKRGGQQVTQAQLNSVAAPSSTGLAPQKTNTSSISSTSFAANCETAVSGKYGCSVAELPAEPGYQVAIKITGPNHDFMDYIVKKVTETQGEVWWSQAGGNWNYVGFWQPTFPGSNCLSPSANQTMPVQDALGQDAWLLCMQQ